MDANYIVQLHILSSMYCIKLVRYLDIIWLCILIIMIIKCLFEGILFICNLVASFASLIALGTQMTLGFSIEAPKCLSQSRKNEKSSCETVFERHSPNSKMADICYLALDASFPRCSPQIIPNDSHFLIYFIYLFFLYIW